MLLQNLGDAPTIYALALFAALPLLCASGASSAPGFGGGIPTNPPLPVIPNLRIDYVLASNRFMPRSSQVLRVKASDHYPVVADLTLLEPMKAPSAELVERERQTPPAGSPQ